MTQAEGIRQYFIFHESATTREMINWFEQKGIPYNSVNTVSGHLSKMHSRGELRRDNNPSEYTYFRNE